LIVVGLQFPLMPLVELPGSAGATEFWHKGPIALKVGTVGFVIVIFSVAVVAHCPALGVKVYVLVPTVEVLIVAGLHVPLIEFVELKGSDGATEF
jgi:hypothetical protein